MDKFYRLIYYSHVLGMTFTRFATSKLTLKEFIIEKNNEEKELPDINFWILQENTSISKVNDEYIFGNAWHTIEMAQEIQNLYNKMQEEANPELESFKKIIKLWQQKSL